MAEGVFEGPERGEPQPQPEGREHREGDPGDPLSAARVPPRKGAHGQSDRQVLKGRGEDPVMGPGRSRHGPEAGADGGEGSERDSDTAQSGLAGTAPAQRNVQDEEKEGGQQARLSNLHPRRRGDSEQELSGLPSIAQGEELVNEVRSTQTGTPSQVAQGDQLSFFHQPYQVDEGERKRPGGQAQEGGDQMPARLPPLVPQNQSGERQDQDGGAQLLEGGEPDQRAEREGVARPGRIRGLAVQPEGDHRQAEQESESHRPPVETAEEKERAVRQQQGEEEGDLSPSQDRVGAGGEERKTRGHEEDAEPAPVREKETAPRKAEEEAVEMGLDRRAIGGGEDADAMEVETEGGERRLSDPGEGADGLMEFVVLRTLSRETDAGEDGESDCRGQAEGDGTAPRPRHWIRVGVARGW